LQNGGLAVFYLVNKSPVSGSVSLLIFFDLKSAGKFTKIKYYDCFLVIIALLLSNLYKLLIFI